MKTLIVTGGTSGIGRGVVDLLGHHFQRIINIDVHDDNDPIDVRDFIKITKKVESVIGEGDDVFLFANAGVAFFLHPDTKKPAAFCEMPIEQLHSLIGINFVGQVNVLHAFIGEVIRKKAKGNIVLVSSISADFSGGPLFAVYDATKAATSALVKRLAPYAKQGIRINAIQPGSVRTNIGGWDAKLEKLPEGLEIVKNGQDNDARTLGKEVTVDQIATWVKFLFFENHGANGAVITIDEGLTLAGRGY